MLNVFCIENIVILGMLFVSILLFLSLVWNSINDYILLLDSFIDIEFVKLVKFNGNVFFNKFGGVISGFNYFVFVVF